MSPFAIAVTKYYKLGNSYRREAFLIASEAGKLKVEGPHLVTAALLVGTICSVQIMQIIAGHATAGLASSSHKAADCSIGPTLTISSGPPYIPKALPPDATNIRL
jgi:hypothetical protein